MSDFMRRRLAGLRDQVDQLTEDGAADRALKTQQEICEIMRWNVGEDSPDYVRELVALGDMHFRQEDEAAASRCYHEASRTCCADIRRSYPGLLEDPGNNRPLDDESALEAARRLNQLGKLHWLLGEYDDADRVLRKALVMTRQALGNHHPQIAILVNNLGEIYHAAGDLEKTEEHFVRALRILGDTLGRDHPEFMKSLQDLVRLMADKALRILSQEDRP